MGDDMTQSTAVQRAEAARLVPPGTVRLTLEGDPTPEQVLKASRAMLRLLREIERELRRTGEIAPGTPKIKWGLDVRMNDA